MVHTRCWGAPQTAKGEKGKFCAVISDRLLVFALLALIVIGCRSPFPPADQRPFESIHATATAIAARQPVEYIKDVVAYKDGDGLAVYFVLGDQLGQMTAAHGIAHLRITDSDGNVLYKRDADVTERDFHWTTAGVGAFEHDVFICSFGRISFQRFARYPQGRLSIDLYFDDGTPRVLHAENWTYV